MTLAGFGSLFLTSQLCYLKCSTRRQPTVWEIVNPSQMKMTFHFVPKSGVLRKTSLTLEVVKYELRN